MKWIYLLGFLAMPAVALVHFWFGREAGGGHKTWEPTVTFVLAGLSIVPLARLMGQATQILAVKTGPTWGGLINATFGNAAELIIGIVALCKGLNEVAMASLAGSIMGNLLLVAGAAMLIGGWRRECQTYSRASAEANAGLLALAVTGMLLPAIFHFSFAGKDRQLAQHEHGISVGTSVVLLLVYALGLLFTLRTHRHIFSPSPAPSTRSTRSTSSGRACSGQALTDAGPAPLSGAAAAWSLRKCVWVLLAATAAVAVLSEWLVGSVHLAAEALQLNYVFVGVILVAIVGNAAEHSTAILLARRNDMDTAMTIVFQSSLQIALFVTPLLVLLSTVLVGIGVKEARQLNMVFSALEVVGVFVSVGIVVTLNRNGESNWFEGVLLLAVYAILAITFFYIP